ncbi:uncharacterized protein FSUBG_8019 [Fusarium subglutinans]|uniref:Uncharacterized protein n=1 Tax=Gibberella subglutinans TaxID=42677 RepID=A0A8H5UYB3_GIBSU|nr:uncharacterized protein FSUBG_8019 [Fusarium subglutinans]KAF5601654.1 hypothetical protein FSUBG_8019 [Fusarium subglutinans]
MLSGVNEPKLAVVPHDDAVLSVSPGNFYEKTSSAVVAIFNQRIKDLLPAQASQFENAIVKYLAARDASALPGTDVGLSADSATYRRQCNNDTQKRDKEGN